jgi:ribosomal protein S18 acetylase RimI-like enzyme
MASSAKPLPLIRRITLENLPAFKETRLRALAESPSAFGSTYEAESQFSDAQWRARLERWNGERGVGLLAMEGNVAYGIAGALVDDDDDGRATVVSVWVASAQRGQGVGRLLMQALTAWARERGVGVLRLMVTNSNAIALRFYGGLGFKMTGRTDPHPNDPALRECEMSRVVE